MEIRYYVFDMNTSKTTDQTNKYIANLHHGAKPSTHEYARDLRQKSTDAEQKMWTLLRNRKLKGKKFRRQHAIANYVLDFYCHEAKLAIELDGNFHKAAGAKEYDAARSARLTEIGITVLRFWNEQVINDTDNVILKIGGYLQ